jgi:hypothetical protein
VKNPIVKIDTRRIKDWPTFHEVFAEIFGFPDFYGRNMNAWIDCLTSLYEPEDGMTSIHAPPGGVLVLQLDYVDDFCARCPEMFAAIVEDAAFVNWRRTEIGQEPVLAISFHKTTPR